MPNWCENNLTVRGPKKDLLRFKKKVVGRGPYESEAPVQPLSFHATVPQPKFDKDDDGWYNWRVSRWGTKWEPSDVRLEESFESLTYYFDTAWGPPLVWLQATASQFPKLEFRLFYAEGGCDFAGVARAEGDDFGDEPYGNYVSGMIDEHGSYTTVCEHCESDLELNDVTDSRVCSNCLEHLCSHCKELDTNHGENGKCLFDASVFTPLKDKNDSV